MAAVGATQRILTTTQDADLARSLLGTLEAQGSALVVERSGHEPSEVPGKVDQLIQHVLRAIASGNSIRIPATPRVVTTSTAVAMLGDSRPTVMKLVQDGTLPSHKVGTHTRLLSEDVRAAKRSRRERERAAFAALLDAEGDEI